MEKQISLFDADNAQWREAEMEWLFWERHRVPQEKRIPAGDPLRPQVQAMLRQMRIVSREKSMSNKGEE